MMMDLIFGGRRMKPVSSARHRLRGCNWRTGLVFLVVLSALAPASGRPAAAAPVSDDLQLDAVLAVDPVADDVSLSPAGDLLALTLYHDTRGRSVLRLSFLSLDPARARAVGRAFALGVEGDDPAPVDLRIDLQSDQRSEEIAALALASRGGVYALERRRGDTGARVAEVWTDPSDPDALYLTLTEDLTARATEAAPIRLAVAATVAGDRTESDTLAASYPPSRAYEANCALVLHGNQGIGYSDVFHGRSDDLDGSGFDEALQVHEGTSVPGNFHLSGTAQTSAEWAARNGDTQDFNAWLAAGVSAGWAGMITSAYAQHIMPFVQDDMNDWAVNIETQMVDHRYGYFPTVAWVPERVWLNTSGYPSSGVNDWIGDNWQAHGVYGVILDDDVHLTGHDNHQIHTLAANGLRLIPRDRTFTGNIVGGNGQGSLDILTGLAGSGVGEYRIAVLAEDWEAIGELGGWATITPNAKETYDWFVGKCSTESAWLHTWKLSDALSNPDFVGDTMDLTPGTYNEIGGFDGYGGGNNGWYGHWAGWIPWANGGDGSGSCRNDGIGNCKNYGTLWNDAFGALMAAPDNEISQAGWYVLMTNLHETAWHDGLGGDISGWQHNYSAHMKNAHIYAEAAHWAGGEYVVDTAAYFSDIDNDGYSELILHNDHLFAVFRGAGGRLTNLFVKGDGWSDTAIGNDNAYWSGTNADYNDDNHVGAFSDVSPDYQHDQYDIAIVDDGSVSGRAVVRFSHHEVTRDVALATGDEALDVVYRVGQTQHWWQSGFSPSLVDLVWNAELDRVWATDQAYMGQRNPNTGIATAWVVGTGGAGHQRDFSGTLMKGDELTGSGVMQMKLFAGTTSAPDGGGEIAELRALAGAVTDTLGPLPVAAALSAVSGQLRITFDQPTVGSSFTAGQADIGGIDLAGTAVVSTTAAYTVAYTVPDAAAALILALAEPDRLLSLAAGAVVDENAIGGAPVGGDDAVPVDVALTAMAIDGNIEAAEWDGALALADSNDSAWTSSNEIDRLLVAWDLDYLYLAIDGQVSGNSWLLYLDVDPGSGQGETDLTAIDAWERGASFTAIGFAADFQYGCYQHQGVWDGDGFWELTSATTTTDRSGEIDSAFDAQHVFGTASGSELAIPWNTLYDLGPGAVPTGAEISLVASICWDPEPDGALGGDSTPNNTAALLPVIDNVWTVIVDADGNGVPDGEASPVPSIPTARVRLLPNIPNPFNPSTLLRFEVPGQGLADVDVSIYDIRGRRIATLVQRTLEPGLHQVVWTGRSDAGLPVAAGTYFCQFRCRGQAVTRPLSLIK